MHGFIRTEGIFINILLKMMTTIVKWPIHAIALDMLRWLTAIVRKENYPRRNKSPFFHSPTDFGEGFPEKLVYFTVLVINFQICGSFFFSKESFWLRHCHLEIKQQFWNVYFSIILYSYENIAHIFYTVRFSLWN